VTDTVDDAVKIRGERAPERGECALLIFSERAPEHATACGEVIGACSDLKLYWNAEICGQITAQAEKIFGKIKLCE
jgi:hypothetical protein